MSMWLSNAVLLVLNLPRVGVWARVLTLPPRYLHPITVTLACTGLYAVNYATVDVWLAAAFGLVGFGLRIAALNAATPLLGFVLSRPIEANAQRALAFADGDWRTFLTHPIGASLLVLLAAGLLVAGARRMLRRRTLRRRDADRDNDSF